MLEGLIVKGVTYFFPGELALKLVKNGLNRINSTNPLILTKNITLTVLNCCAPLPVKLVAHCLGVGTLIVVSVTSLNPATIGLAIHFVTEIHDNC